VVSLHNIEGSDVFSRARLSPGYGAVRSGGSRRWQWRWIHTGLVFGVIAVGVTVAAMQGLLP
jgi:hypothetical protein